MAALVPFIVALINTGSVSGAVGAMTVTQWVTLATSVASDLAALPEVKAEFAKIAPSFSTLVQGIEAGDLPELVAHRVFAALLAANGQAAIARQDYAP